MNLTKVIALITVISVLVVFSCSNVDNITSEVQMEKPQLLEFLCDAETIEGDVFVNNGNEFKNASSVSSEFSKSGKQSCMSYEDSPFSFVHVLKEVKEGEIIHAEIWLKRNAKSNSGQIIIADDGKLQFDDTYFETDYTDDWVKIENNFIAHQDLPELKVYGYNINKDTVYFDDLKISRLEKNDLPPVNDSTLKIILPPKSSAKLDSLISLAKAEGIISDRLKKFVKGQIVHLGDTMPAEFRLKGDWADHLNTPKYSLRIRVKGDHSMNGLKTFSIQNPETRGFLHEWFIHKLFEYEDVLTTRYDFTNVEINGVNKGVYAVEEHFEKQLVEHKKRREGPILKLDETGFWQINYDLKQGKERIQSPSFESSKIVPFRSSKTFSNSNLKSQFIVAQGLLNQYKSKDKNPNEFLDLAQFAKYIGILDLGNIEHAAIWHNQRQYFNPISNKLEPIGYDCYSNLNIRYNRRAFYGLKDNVKKLQRPTNMNLALMNNNEFKDLYSAFLNRIMKDEYLDLFFEKIESELQEHLDILSFEYPFYSFSKIFFRNNIQKMNEKRDELDKLIQSNTEYRFTKDRYETLPDSSDIFRPDIALQVFSESNDDVHGEFSLTNYHQSEIEVIGYSTMLFPDKIIELERPMKFSPYNSDPAQWRKLKLRADTRHFFYKPKNLNGDTIRAKVSIWPRAKKMNYLGEHSNLPVEKTEVDGEYVLKSGTYQFSKNQVFYGKKLIIESGVNIDLTNTAGIIVYAPVEMKGTPEQKISVTSTDNTGSGFNVISNDGKSVLNHVKFSGLNSMNKNNWILTGAVTIYGHYVDIQNCSFVGNKCEDGLNLIRCKMNVDKCSISSTFSDGFDADFCQGTVSRCTFNNTGNDAIDFSGSEIQISDCNFTNPGDKGISGGEDSTLSIKNCSVSGAIMGVASKDFSKLDITGMTLKNCKYGYAIYRKKPEYGPASIVVNSSKEENIEIPVLLDLGSEFTKSGKSEIGKSRIDVDALYVGFSK